MSIHHEVISFCINELLQICDAAVHTVPMSMRYKCLFVSDVELIIYWELRVVVAVAPHHVDLTVKQVMYQLFIPFNVSEMYQHIHIANYVVYLLYAAALAMGITYYQYSHLFLLTGIPVF